MRRWRGGAVFAAGKLSKIFAKKFEQRRFHSIPLIPPTITRSGICPAHPRPSAGRSTALDLSPSEYAGPSPIAECPPRPFAMFSLYLHAPVSRSVTHRVNQPLLQATGAASRA